MLTYKLLLYLVPTKEYFDKNVYKNESLISTHI